MSCNSNCNSGMTPKDERCPYCSNALQPVFHLGGLCPKIHSVEYFKDGTIKRIEFK